MQDVIRIGTRKSRLALIQTDIVRRKIEEAFPQVKVEVVEMSTRGDELLDRSLTSFGGKGVFTQELEEALLSGEIDLAVHSAKDMPMDFPEGLGIGAVLKRASAEDVVVTCDGTKLRDLEPGSIVGTSSLRRELQIRRIHPLVKIRMLRGNVQTRLRKLSEGQYDAILLAAAGLERLELTENKEFYYEKLSPEICLPAAGQAILAVESKEGHLSDLLRAIHDPEAAVMLSAERAFLKEIGGSCNAPAAALSRLDRDMLFMDALYASTGTGESMRRTSGSKKTGFDTEKAAELGRELAKKLRQGKVWLVGAGPGDFSLVTQGCLSCIRAADVVVYDSLATDSLLAEARPDAELIYAGKRASHHHLKQGETNALLIEKAKEGKNVVRLKGGDPFIFGRGGEEAQELKSAGIDYEIVPGVSSCYGAPAYAGVPVTHRDHASSFHVITGHEGAHKESNVLDYATLAREEGTLIFLMGLKNLPNIVENLIANGKDPRTPAAVVQEGTTARQNVAVGTLETIVKEAALAGIETPAISIVGSVVGLRRELDWFGKLPLSGKRVLITATEHMSEKLVETLSKAGAEPVRFGLIYTEALKSPKLLRFMEELDSFTWIVFTSGNGVELFFEHMLAMGKDIRDLASVRFAVIGEGTKAALLKHGIRADFVPTAFSSKHLAEEWTPTLEKGRDRIALLRAREASHELNHALDEAGISYLDVPLYHTAVDGRKAEELNRVLPQTDYVTLCSASAAKAFAGMLTEESKALLNREPEEAGKAAPKVVCIGPVTEKAAAGLGLPVYRSAVDYTADGIRDVLLYEELKREG